MSVKSLKYLLYLILSLIICYKLLEQSQTLLQNVANSSLGTNEEEAAQLSLKLEEYIAPIQPSDSEESVDLDGLYGEHYFSDLSISSPLKKLREKLDKDDYSTKGVAFGRSNTPNLIDSDGLGKPTYFKRGSTLIIKAPNEHYGTEQTCYMALDKYDLNRLFVTNLCFSKGGGYPSNSAGILTLSSPLKGAAKELFNSKAMDGQTPKELHGLWTSAKESCGNVDDDDSIFVGGTSIIGDVEYDDVELTTLKTSTENGLITISGIRGHYSSLQICSGTMEKMNEHYYATLSCKSSESLLDEDNNAQEDTLKFVLCEKITPKALKKWKP